MRVIALILALMIVASAFMQSCGAVVSSAYDVDLPTLQGTDDPQAAVGAAIVVFVVALFGALAVMTRPRTTATIFSAGAVVGIVIGAANVDVYGSLLAWGILMGLASIFSYFGERELHPKPAMVEPDSGGTKVCTVCGHQLNLEDAFCTNCGSRQLKQESTHDGG